MLRRKHAIEQGGLPRRNTEQLAKGQLETQWSGFVASDRVMCTGATVGSKSDADSVPPSYVDLLTCLQDQQLARKLPKN
jgi:hypothetical protein